MDIPSNNQRFKETGIIIFRIDNGKIAEQWCEMSKLQLVQQLGVEYVELFNFSRLLNSSN